MLLSTLVVVVLAQNNMTQQFCDLWSMADQAEWEVNFPRAAIAARVDFCDPDFEVIYEKDAEGNDIPIEVVDIYPNSRILAWLFSPLEFGASSDSIEPPVPEDTDCYKYSPWYSYLYDSGRVGFEPAIVGGKQFDKALMVALPQIATPHDEELRPFIRGTWQPVFVHPGTQLSMRAGIANDAISNGAEVTLSVRIAGSDNNAANLAQEWTIWNYSELDTLAIPPSPSVVSKTIELNAFAGDVAQFSLKIEDKGDGQGDYVSILELCVAGDGNNPSVGIAQQALVQQIAAHVQVGSMASFSARLQWHSLMVSPSDSMRSNGATATDLGIPPLPHGYSFNDVVIGIDESATIYTHDYGGAIRLQLEIETDGNELIAMPGFVDIDLTSASGFLYVFPYAVEDAGRLEFATLAEITFESAVVSDQLLRAAQQSVEHALEKLQIEPEYFGITNTWLAQSGGLFGSLSIEAADVRDGKFLIYYSQATGLGELSPEFFVLDDLWYFRSGASLDGATTQEPGVTVTLHQDGSPVGVLYSGSELSADIPLKNGHMCTRAGDELQISIATANGNLNQTVVVPERVFQLGDVYIVNDSEGAEIDNGLLANVSVEFPGDVPEATESVSVTKYRYEYRLRVANQGQSSCGPIEVDWLDPLVSPQSASFTFTRLEEGKVLLITVDPHGTAAALTAKVNVTTQSGETQQRSAFFYLRGSNQLELEVASLTKRLKSANDLDRLYVAARVAASIEDPLDPPAPGTSEFLVFRGRINEVFEYRTDTRRNVNSSLLTFPNGSSGPQQRERDIRLTDELNGLIAVLEEGHGIERRPERLLRRDAARQALRIINCMNEP